VTFSYLVSDGIAPAVAATATLAIAPVNDAPVAGADSGGAALTTVEDTPLTILPATLLGNDTDVDLDILTITSVAAGTGGTVALVSGNVVFTPTANYSGPASFSYTISDGNGGTSSSTVTVTVTSANDAPLNTVPGALSVNEDTNLSINGLSVNDADAGAGTLTTTLSVLQGTLTVSSSGSGTAAVAGNGTGTVTLTGTSAQINATLAASVIYRGAADFNGAETLTMVTNDGGNTGGPVQSDTDTVAITVNAVNDAPVAVIVPASYIVTQSAILDLKNTGLSVSDIDALSGTVGVTLSVGEGTLTVTAGTSGAAVTGSGTSAVTISGTLAQINALLNTNATSAVSYTDTNPSPVASTVLTLSIIDNGNTGGGALTASDTAAININRIISSPPAAPQLIDVPASVNFRLHGPAVTLAPGLNLSDVDSPTLVGATVRIAAGTFAGDGDVLSATVAGTGITASYNAATETLTLSGTDTLAHYSQVLHSVTFQSTATNATDFGTHQTRTVEWQLNDGGGANNLSAVATTTVTIKPLAVNDFDGNGKSDLLWQNADGTPAVWLMDGLNVMSGANVGFNPGAAWHEIGTGDFNGDGKADILWQNNDGTIAEWFLDGANLLSGGSVAFNPGPAWHALATGDFNGDGKADILWQNNDGQAAVWLMDGLNIVQGANAGPNLGAAWHSIGTGDFNADGKADILWQHDDGTAAVWLMDGTSVMSGANIATTPGSAWSVQAAGDFDGDGKADILWQHDNGQAAVWLMDGTTLRAGANVGPNFGPSWQIHTAADFNGDGKADIEWQNSDGTPAVWLMDGFNLLTGNNVGSNPGASWHLLPQHHDLV
jgi:hypothetical protein